MVTDASAHIPSIRASYMQENLAAVRHLGGESEAAVHAALGAAFVTRVRDAAKSEWLPADFDAQLSEAVVQVCGEEGIRLANQKAFVSAAGGGILGPIVSAALRILGITPNAILKYSHVQWNAAMRDAGEVTGHRISATEAHVRMAGLPTRLASSRPWLASMMGVMDGVCEVTQAKNHNVVLRPDATPTDWTLVVTWSAE